MSCIPFVEYYRPKHFDDIVLDHYNKKILKNIIETSYFPNLLFYGPPGTGKTTTIINLVNAYQEKLDNKNKGLMIHLNASDERGIDIIRNQISLFVNSNSLFQNGMKFVILDEVDYMTKNAQQALRYLLQNYSSGVRFCLICNYISKIDEGLQNEFLRLRFNQLPEKEIFDFLKKISTCENINLSDASLINIQKLYKSDIRSMLNFIQSNQYIIDNDIKIIDINVWNKLYDSIKNKDKLDNILKFIQDLSLEYNIDKKNIIKDFLNYIIRYKHNIVNTKFLNFVENIMHLQDCKNTHYINYSITSLLSILSEQKEDTES